MSLRFAARFLLIATAFAGAITATCATWSDDKSAGKRPEKPLASEAARKLKSPVPFSKPSIARGKVLYVRACTECHGADGKSQVDVIANATDLTNPKAWKSGTSEGEIFRSIRDGAGEAMPPFAEKVSKEEDLWHMVNYLRSLWPDSARPKLEKSSTN
ncbi:MAG TPA: c-type cytochrome [Planctomycetaceae bacterium]|nr:c-type cytochrome [Planctomycetaceae bacterium]